MITRELVPDLQRWTSAYKPRMLMLGAQESRVPGYGLARDWFRQFVGDEYDDLDLADGDLKLDLNADLFQLSGRYMTVCNLGTIEHVWNVHAAFCNALRAVMVGGQFLNHSPVGGWSDDEGLFNHGLHMTRAVAIEEFVANNGFAVREARLGKVKGRGSILWLRAAKIAHIDALADFRPIYRLRGLSPRYC